MSNKFLDNPPRLFHDAELGPLLREASVVTFDDERLAKNRAALLSRAAQTAPSISPAWLPRFLPYRRTAFATAAALLLMSAGALAVIYVQTQSDHISEKSPQAEPQAALQVKSRRISGRRPALQETALVESTPEPDAGISPYNLEQKSRRNYQGESSLDEQIRMFNKAKQQLAMGEFDSAVKQVRRLKQRYPKGPLAFEADELQARGLLGLHRYKEASDTVKSLIHLKIPTRKKAQLYRFLGDLQVKQNHCDTAVESYRMALGLGLSNRESQAAQAGIRKCTP